MGFAPRMAAKIAGNVAKPIVGAAKSQVKDLKSSARDIKGMVRNPKSVLKAGIASKSPTTKRFLEL